MKYLPFLLCLARLPALADEPAFEIYSVTDKNLFPSAIISTATVDWNGDSNDAEDKKVKGDAKLKKDEIAVYGDENGWLGARIFEPKPGSKVKVTVAIEGYLKPSSWEGVLKKPNESVLYPQAEWDYDALAKVHQQRPANLSVKVNIDGEDLPEQKQVVVIRSMNDCPFYVVLDEEAESDEEGILDLSWLFAAYVNENHPGLDAILRDALASAKAGELIDSFDGYQSEDPETVDMQVFAVWNALQRRGIQYSDISTTVPSDYVYAQTVRFLDDSIDAKQANCVDGSVLMASLLTKVGIKCHLVMVPGHCFLAYEREEIDWEQEPTVEDLLEEGLLIGVETTMLGSAEQKEVAALAKMNPKVKAKEFKKSLDSFTGAVEAGCTSLAENADGLNQVDMETQMISVADAREFGITPLASQTKQKQ
jgi:hypothetical protein